MWQHRTFGYMQNLTSWNARSMVENGGKADMGGQPISVAIDLCGHALSATESRCLGRFNRQTLTTTSVVLT